MLLFLNIFICIILCNDHIPDYQVSFQGEIGSSTSCTMLLKRKNGSIVKKYSVKSFVICIKRIEQEIDRPLCYVIAGNQITTDFTSTVLNQMPHGSYRLVIKDVICGPISESNTDLKHFRLKDFELEVKL